MVNFCLHVIQLFFFSSWRHTQIKTPYCT